MNRIFTIFTFLVSTLVFSQEWQPTFEKSFELATKKSVPLMLVFAGSDWCAPCIKLDRQIWQSQEFIDYSNNNLVLYKADFPRKKVNRLTKEIEQKNEELAERFNPRGFFPLVVLIDNEGNSLGELGYKNVSPQEYISDIKKLH
ncbi:thioredoxin family protein [Cytophaga sp. FL35]|uniref:thioredoxin family protein n=1 Tax=Cytophaga sp. FL35 TaxID=1904456 RepID=UPI001653B230|nr:thioredoxin family protein [Cytophaga sp. FL35]MBC6998224.1 thioredoxin family protein [Cytophaga sp. FL35]